ncbi:hypothetical protein TSUD_402770 [Trifolium subterraneum]|uniref:S-acyltransferase n=1 Tax=Trifolium subterraneum TaxID=3900 RepID=A0A2Z6NRN9_TRISU|nr:hypothetical protein TSUD_402770 [Trifolium subterraneum]
MILAKREWNSNCTCCSLTIVSCRLDAESINSSNFTSTIPKSSHLPRTCTASDLHLAWVIIDPADRKTEKNIITPAARDVLYGTVVVGLTITLLSLTGWHVYLILHNMTTIEYYEGNRAKWLAAKTGQSYRHLYNIGAYKNLTLILGPTMLKWLCPTSVSHLKDGVSFPTLRDNS